MYKRGLIALVCILCMLSLYSDGKNNAVHAFVMIDTSLSMEENNTFSFLQEWLQNQFLLSLAGKDNTLTVFFFYGETNKVFSKQLNTHTNVNEIQTIIANAKPDGPFTDIGLAMDTLKLAAQNPANGSIPIALIFSDLIQEAAWPSEYAGTYYDFAERYLTEDRIIELKKDCYQVTLQLEKAKTIEQRANKIYTAIKDSTEEPLYRQ